MEVSKALRRSIKVKEKLLHQPSEIKKIVKISDIIITALRNGGKLVLFGNGGSAADAQHIACELISKFKFERKGLSAIALTVNTSILTAIGNDYSFDNIFSRQVEALVNSEDVVIGISTSGKSINVIKGLKYANMLGATTIGLTGRGGGDIRKIVDICIMIPSNITPHIQEAHITVGHIICQIVEEKICESSISRP